MLPTFVVIGAAKAGTTTIFDLLGEHPEVFVTTPKEPHFFSALTTFDARWDWYRSLFAGSESHVARGEASTSYAHPNRIDFAAPRLRRYVPDCRLIYMVRHPIRRLESDWKMRSLEDRLDGPIGEVIEGNASLVTFGLYWKHLSVYRTLFPDEQILVVFLEDLVNDPKAEIERAYRHVGVDPTFVPPSLGEPRNTARDRARSVATAAAARRVPGARRLAALLPDPVVELGRRVIARPERYENEVEWSPEALRAVSRLFREDSRELLAYCGKAMDFWDLGEEA